MIYRLQMDRFKYLAFDITPEELEKQLGPDYFFLLDEEKWLPFWHPLSAEFYNDGDARSTPKLPDVCCWFTDNLVLSEKAYTLLCHKLSSCGEFLPVEYKGNRYYIFHVTAEVGMEAIDQNMSQRVVEESGFVDVKKLIFKQDVVVDELVFRSTYTANKGVFCTESFRQMIEEASFEGIHFSTDLAEII